jgi:Zn-dependent protease with chaperone function
MPWSGCWRFPLALAMTSRDSAAAFVGPSTLLCQFLVLAAAVLASTSQLAAVIAVNVPSQPFESAPPGSLCWNVQGRLLFESSGWLGLGHRYPQCFNSVNPLPFPTKLAATLGLAALCAIGYLVWPYWRMLRSRPVRADRLPGIGPALEELRAIAGVRVRFVAALTDPSIDGLAFGHVGRRYVLIPRGLIKLSATDPPAFQAIVLHELAHVRNRDLDVTYLTVLLVRAFLGVVILPALLLTARPLSVVSVNTTGRIGLWVQLAGLAVLVLLSHYAIVRERELRADGRAMTWPAGQALARVLRAADEQRQEQVPDGRRRWLRTVVSLHPDLAMRTRVIADPGALSNFGPASIFAMGLAFGLAATSMAAAFGDGLLGLLPAHPYLPVLAVPALAPVTLVMGFAVGLAVWRACRWSSSGRGLLSLQRAGLALGAGLGAGELLTAQESGLGPQLTPLSASSRAFYVCLLLAGSCLLACWLAVSARAWLSLMRRGVGGPVLGAVSGAALLTAWLPLAVGIRITPGFATEAPLGHVLQRFTAQLQPSLPTVTVATATLAAFPLLGLLGSFAARRIGHRQDPDPDVGLLP